MVEKILLSELEKKFKGECFTLVVALGFDQRRTAVFDALASTAIATLLGLYNPAHGDVLAEDEQMLSRLARFGGEVIGGRGIGIVQLIDMLAIKLAADSTSDRRILIDCTSMSHELLVALIGLLEEMSLKNRAIILYCSASKYSFNTEPEHTWLSRGVTDIRSILGFPGIMLPSKKLHLVVMAGFEVERAMNVISSYEPTTLSIGYGGVGKSFATGHHELNRGFVERLNSFLEGQDEVCFEKCDLFEFSCIDPFETRDILIRHFDENNDKNIIVCPLNTKVSAVGAALAVLLRPRVQICYAQPLEYNEDGYAVADEHVTLVPLLE